MTISNFIKKHYSYKEQNFFKVYTFLVIVGFFFILFSFLLLSSLISITDDLLQKQNVYNIDCIDLNTISTSEMVSYPLGELPPLEDLSSNSSYVYYRDKVVLIPKKVYVYLGISFISFLFLLEYFFYLVHLYFKYRDLSKRVSK